MAVLERGHILEPAASMKAPPKRKGNSYAKTERGICANGLNESPSEKEGKLGSTKSFLTCSAASMKAPPKRKGNPPASHGSPLFWQASMKAPPKRKGNCRDARHR